MLKHHKHRGLRALPKLIALTTEEVQQVAAGAKSDAIQDIIKMIKEGPIGPKTPDP
jgi:hypothetical protein